MVWFRLGLERFSAEVKVGIENAVSYQPDSMFAG